MAIRNSTMLDHENSIFSVLDFVVLQLPRLTWQGEDLDFDTAKGSIFHGFHGGEIADGQPEAASVTVADVTLDSGEPDVSALRESDVQALDESMRQEVAAQLEADGRSLSKWMHSQLNANGDVLALVTAYIVSDNGRELQHIALRTTVKGRKIVAISMFDIAMKETLASPLFNVLRTIRFKSGE